MEPDPLNEREFELVNIIGKKIGFNQRDLSRHMELSLGQTNMLIRRLVSKGYIRIQQLNKKKVEYILTPQGFAEKMRKSIKYTVNTINSIGLIKNRLREIFRDLFNNGRPKCFYIVGESDLALLVDMIIKEIFLAQCSVKFVKAFSEIEEPGIVLICKEGMDERPLDQFKSINLIQELAKSPDWAYQNTA